MKLLPISEDPYQPFAVGALKVAGYRTYSDARDIGISSPIYQLTDLRACLDEQRDIIALPVTLHPAEKTAAIGKGAWICVVARR